MQVLAYYVPAFLLLLIGCQPAGLKENLLEKMFFFGHCPNGSVMCTCVGVVYDNDIINNRIIFFFSCCNITRTLNKEIADSAQTEYCSTFQGSQYIIQTDHSYHRTTWTTWTTWTTQSNHFDHSDKPD